MQELTALDTNIAKVAEMMKTGKMVLPDPGAGYSWILADTGSSIHVANLSKHYPGANLNTDGNGAVYASATGDPFQTTGSFSVPFTTEKGHPRSGLRCVRHCLEFPKRPGGLQSLCGQETGSSFGGSP